MRAVGVILKRTGVIQTSGLSAEAAASEAAGKATPAWTVLSAGVVLQERYEILSVLGHGGMSTVYRARDRRFANVDRLVAVKEMFNVTQDAAARRHRLRRSACFGLDLRARVLERGEGALSLFDASRTKLDLPYHD